MRPTLLPGDRLVVVRPWRRRLRPGDVVALRDPRQPARLMVKRVAAVDRATGDLTVAGDDPAASTDSRHFGPVPSALVRGRVVYRYAPPERAGAMLRP